ncbi:MAG: hypothetical protein HY873_04635 [Chloroflexi bacterium]|nr:hypothetical protein [Chloroflexota bacterium]
MPEGWQVGIFIHVLAVFALGGGLAISFATFEMMRHARTVQEVRVWSGLGRILSQYQVLPATALVLLLSGGYLVSELNEEWSDLWISFSALALVAASGVGLLVITPRMQAIGRAAGPAPDGPVPAGIMAQLRDPVLFGAILANDFTSIAIVWNMTIQPGSAGAVLSIVILAGLGAAAGYALSRSGRG